jgi:phenylacetate-CoA ligase
MGFFHIRSLPGTSWPAVPYPQVSLVWNAYQALDRTQWFKPAEIESLQLRQLNALLDHCRKQVPYYARVLSDAGFANRPIENLADFRRVPLLTRELYQRHFAEIQARTLPEGMLTSPKPSFTSGTSGVPIEVRKTNRDALWWSAFFLRDLEWCNIDPRGKLATIRMIAHTREELPRALLGGSVPYWNKSLQLLLETGTCYGIDMRADPRKQLHWLRQVRPDYLLSMPTNLEFLASLLIESGQRLAELKLIQTMGEPLADEARQRIEKGFGVPVKNLYSTTESGYIASPCPSGNGLHVHSENVLCEVLDAENNPCQPGQTGRLIFTSLHNFIAPFIRYEIQDEVTLAAGPCPCGRGLPLWSHVEGRRYPALRLADGRLKSSIGIVVGLRQVGGVHQFQMIQQSVGHAIVRVVPNRTWTLSHADRMIQVLHHEFESPIRVDVEEKLFIERPAGGKLRIIVVEEEGSGFGVQGSGKTNG